jgi:hypothetical protein
MRKEQNKNNTETIQPNHRQMLFQNTVKIIHTKKFDIKYTQIIQGPYNKTGWKKNFCTYYESLVNVRNSATE